MTVSLHIATIQVHKQVHVLALLEKELKVLNDSLKVQGIKVQIYIRRKSLFLRAYLPPKDDIKGKNIQTYIPINLEATEPNLTAATLKAHLLNKEKIEGTFRWPNWVKEELPGNIPPKAKNIISEIIKSYKKKWWENRVSKKIAQRTWDSYNFYFQKLDPFRILTAKYVIEEAEKYPVGSKSRFEFVKCAKKLAKHQRIPDWYLLDDYKPKYEPEIRDHSDPKEMLDFVLKHRDHPRFGWVLAALYVYGVRPSESYSLIPLEGDIAVCLSLKKKNALPPKRWPLALYPDKKSKKLLNIENIHRGLEFDPNKPREYDPARAKIEGDALNYWLNSINAPYDPYDFRHAWAIRNLKTGQGSTIGAKAMGNSSGIYEKVYTNTMQEDDMREIATKLNKNLK